MLVPDWAGAIGGGVEFLTTINERGRLEFNLLLALNRLAGELGWLLTGELEAVELADDE